VSKRVVAVLGLFLLGVASLPAQETARQAPVFGTDVSLVLLPVFVIDGDGKAARGLRAEDFEIREDGAQAKVVSFRYVDTTEAQEDEVPLASAARRRFLLLFDKSFTDPSGLRRSQRAAGDFVRRRLGFSDLAAVATFDIHNGVRLVAGFTQDRALLVHAIDTLGVPSLTRISDPLALAADLDISDLARVGAGVDESTPQGPQALLEDMLKVAVGRMRAAEEQVYQQHIEKLLGGFEALAGALRGVEGRKQVLYFSAGFDARLLVGQWGQERRAAADAVIRGRLWEVDGATRYGDSRLRDSLTETTRNLAAADTVVHSIDVTGLGHDLSFAQSEPGAQVGDTSNRESLNLLAAETGGRLFQNANDLKGPLAEMLEMTSRYYVLGIQPEHERGPGAYHKLKVKVARKGMKVSHRPGFFERAAAVGQTALQRQFDLAELVVTGEGRNEVPFTSLCLPFPRPGDQQTLGLVVQVPRESLRWGEASAVEVYAYAVNEDGVVRDHLAQLVRIDPRQADPDAQARGLSLYGTLSVPPDQYTIRLMVRESETGRTALRLLDVTVPPYDGRASFALPPLVMDDPGKWLSLDIGTGKMATSPPEPAFRLATGSFVPRTSFEVHPGATERLMLIVWDPAAPGDPAADVEIRSSLTASDGRVVPAGRLRVEHVSPEGEGRRTYVFSYTPDAVEAGDYTLRIGLEQGGSQAAARSLLRVRPRS
jgi:VWFA-related protein